MSSRMLAMTADEKDGKKRKRGKKKKKDVKKKKHDYSNPEEMSDSDDEDKGKDEHEVRFTANGLMYVDKEGNVVGKVGEEKDQVESESDGDH